MESLKIGTILSSMSRRSQAEGRAYADKYSHEGVWQV